MFFDAAIWVLAFCPYIWMCSFRDTVSKKTIYFKSVIYRLEGRAPRPRQAYRNSEVFERLRHTALRSWTTVFFPYKKNAKVPVQEQNAPFSELTRWFQSSFHGDFKNHCLGLQNDHCLYDFWWFFKFYSNEIKLNNKYVCCNIFSRRAQKS